MLLHNQSKQALSWSMSGKTFKCDAWGSIDIPDKFVAACKSRGLPLGPSPVAPEIRAKRKVEDDRLATDDSAVRAIANERDEAKANLESARAELEKASVEISNARSEAEKLKKSCADLHRQLNDAKAAKEAAEKLAAAAQNAAAKSEERALKAEALLSQSQGKKNR